MDKKSILFPFKEYRQIQKEMIEEVVDVLEKKEHLIMHAPTGLGKTAILAPVIAYAKKHDKKILFLTPRHTQHQIAVELIELIKTVHDEKVRTVDFLGKAHMCALIKDPKEVGNFYEFCRYQRQHDMCDYYTNLNALRKKGEKKQLFQNLIRMSPQNAQEVKVISADAGFCPYEIAAQLGVKARVIIGDYYHLFSESVRESLFNRLQLGLDECIVIVDEAHNLIERSKSLLTFSLSTFTIDQAIAQNEKYTLGVEEELKKLKKQVQELNHLFLNLPILFERK